MAVELQTSPRAADPLQAPPRGSDGSERDPRYRFAGLAVAAIWLAIAAASIWSPDLVSGTEQDRIPLAAMSDWLYAATATGLVLMAFARRSPGASRSLWAGFTMATAAIWLVVAAASIFAPTIETGTDPTTVPIASLVTPIAGVIATAFLSVFAAGSAGADRG